MRRRVLVLSSYSFLGGGESFLLSLLGELAEGNDLEIRAAVPSEGKLSEGLRKQNVPCDLLDFLANRTPGALQLAWANLRFFFFAVARRPDVIFCNNFQTSPYIAAAAFLLRIPVLVAVHTQEPMQDGPRRLVRLLIDPAVFYKTRHVEVMNPIFPGGSRVPLGIRFFPPAPPATGTPQVVSCFGRLYPLKGFEVLIKAYLEAARPGKTVLKIYGDPSDRAYVKELRSLASGREDILFEGHCEDVRGAMEASAVVVVPSHAESTSMVALEAMRLGRAVICTNIGGPSEFIRHGENGLLFFSPDATDLARLLHGVLTDDLLRGRLEREAAKLPARYDIKRVAEAYRATLLSISPSSIFPRIAKMLHLS